MSDSFRAQSRLEWSAADSRTPSDTQLMFGALQRIADASELMAKRHQELIDAKELAERQVTYWREAAERRDRRLIAAKGQITKLKKLVAAATGAPT